jgi:hypothetical protein
MRSNRHKPIRLVFSGSDESLGRFTSYAAAFRYPGDPGDPGEDLDPSPPERNDIIGWITEIGTALGAATAETASS